jgi:hypothetical protein
MVHAAVDYLMVKGTTTGTNEHIRTEDIACYAGDDARKPEMVSSAGNGTRNARKPARLSSACMRSGSKLHLWTGDSGASCHMICSEDGLTECRKIQSSVRIGNGHMLIATKIGKKHVTVVQRDGTITDLVLTNCKYMPKLFAV